MKLVSKIYMALIFLFLYAPIFVLIFFSFNASNSTSLFAGFSLRWYESLFQDKATLQALYNSLILAVAPHWRLLCLARQLRSASIPCAISGLNRAFYPLPISQ